MSKGMAWILAMGSVAILVLASVAAVRLTSDLRVVGFVIMGMGLIAAGLVAYFEWRARLRRRMLAEAKDHRRAA
jgi:hypothetical protein